MRRTSVPSADTQSSTSAFEWSLDARTTLFIRGDNVLNRNYELAADFATGGARVFGGVRWRM